MSATKNSIKNRLDKLQALLLMPRGMQSDDETAIKQRCKLMLTIAETEEERRRLLSTIWEIDHGYMRKWLEEEDFARPKRWADMMHDERAWETHQKLVRQLSGDGDGFLYISIVHPEVPVHELNALHAQYSSTMN